MFPHTYFPPTYYPSHYWPPRVIAPTPAPHHRPKSIQPQIIAPLLSLAAHGTLASSLTFAARHGGTIAMQPPKPGTHETHAARTQKLRTSYAAAHWSTLPDDLKRLWCTPRSHSLSVAYRHYLSRTLKHGPLYTTTATYTPYPPGPIHYQAPPISFAIYPTTIDVQTPAMPFVLDDPADYWSITLVPIAAYDHPPTPPATTIALPHAATTATFNVPNTPALYVIIGAAILHDRDGRPTPITTEPTHASHP